MDPEHFSEEYTTREITAVERTLALKICSPTTRDLVDALAAKQEDRLDEGQFWRKFFPTDGIFTIGGSK